MNRLTAGTVAVGAALLLALTGCSADDGGGGQAAPSQAPQDPKAALVAAVKKTDERDSARVAMRMTAAGTVIEAKGVMRFTAPMLGELAMTMPGAGGQTEKMTVRYTADALYIGGGSLAEQTGKAWLRMRYADLKKAAGSSFGRLLEQQLSQNQDPRQTLKLMLSSQNLTAVGTETVNGEETTHYRGSIDTAKALQDSGQLTGLTAQERAALRKQFATLELSKIDADIWVSGDGWPVRIEQAGKVPQGAFTMRFDLSDFGTPVNVTPPPAAEVQDLGQVLSQLPRSTQSS